MSVVLVSTECAMDSCLNDGQISDEQQEIWRHEWEVHSRRLKKQRLQRRAIFALSLLAEPLSLQWTEIFLDTAFLAWKDAKDEARRTEAQPREQRQLEEALERKAAREGTYDNSSGIQSDLLLTICEVLLSENGPESVSAERLKELFQDLDCKLSPADMQKWSSLLIGNSDSVPTKDIVCWLFGIAPEQLVFVVADWKDKRRIWQEEWDQYHEEKSWRSLRRKAILVLSELAEPLQMHWMEAHLDVVFSAWADYVSDDHRTWALPGPRRLFEREVKSQAESNRNQSFQAANKRSSVMLNSEMAESAVSTAMQGAQRTLSKHGSKALSERDFFTIVQEVAPDMDQEQVEMLIKVVPKNVGGSIPVDGLIAWIFGTSL
jgi:hypothetical protein